MSSVELQFEFEWLKRAINCSKWAISLQVGMRSLKTAGRRGKEEAEGGEIQHRRFLESVSDRSDTLYRGENGTHVSPRIKVRYILETIPTISPYPLSIEDALDYIGIGGFLIFSDRTYHDEMRKLFLSVFFY